MFAFRAGCKTPRTAFAENEVYISVCNQAPLEGGRFHISSPTSCIASRAWGVSNYIATPFQLEFA
jgi:hypothetical protein